MVTIRNERPADVIAREALLDTAYGPARFGKTSERLRRRNNFRSSRPSAAALSAPCGSGTCGPARAAPRCCSGRLRCIRIAAVVASARS